MGKDLAKSRQKDRKIGLEYNIIKEPDPRRETSSNKIDKVMEGREREDGKGKRGKRREEKRRGEREKW